MLINNVSMPDKAKAILKDDNESAQTQYCNGLIVIL